MYLSKIEGAPSLELVNLVLAKKARGESIISLAIGDPSLDTPREIIDAAYQGMAKGDTHYVSSYGTQQVREAVCKKVARRNRIKAEIENTIFLTTKLSVYAALVSISEASFDALVPDPGYFYNEPVILAGGNPVYYKLNSDFCLDIDDIKNKITPRTKAILVNSPSNPTSKVLNKSELTELYDMCAEKGIYIISDEAYEDLTYGKEHFAIGSLEQEPGFVISLFSLSKSYCMTGWRAGYIVGSKKLVYLINKFLENTLTCFPPFIQDASAYALNNCDKYIEQFRQEFAKRRKVLMEKMEEIPSLTPNEIEGAFYAFPKYRSRMSSRELARRILEEQGVALLPGSSFGPSGEQRIRLSFSVSIETIEEGMNKVKSYFKSNPE